jgi:hypothetical protein
MCEGVRICVFLGARVYSQMWPAPLRESTVDETQTNMHRSDTQEVASAAWWRDGRARPLVAAGLLLALSGIAHLVVWAIDGGAWEGPVTWRKPILFGISGGLTAISAGWALTRFPPRRWDSLLAWTTAMALTLEVGLIDLQRWRGVASHFNRSTPLDSFLYDAMGVLILWVTFVVGDLAVRSFRQPIKLPADMRLAMQAGLVTLVWSCGLGIWASVHGERQVLLGLPPERFGVAGVPKFAHGAVIHALQWLPLLAWAAKRVGFEERQRLWLVRVATLGTVFLAVYAVLQTLAGRSRVDGSWPLAGLLVAAVTLLLLPLLFTLVGLVVRRPRPASA